LPTVVVNAMSRKSHYFAWVPGRYLGGAEDYAARVAQDVLNRGWRVTVGCAHQACLKAMSERLPDASFVLGREMTLPGGYGREVVAATVPLRMRARLHRQQLRRASPSVVHAVLPWHWRSDAFLWATKQEALPCLITFQLVAPGYRPPRRYRRLFSELFRQGTRFCAISHNNRRLLAGYYGLPSEQIRCVPNRPSKLHGDLLSPAQKAEVRRMLGIDEADIVILTVGALVAQKGHDTLVSGVADIVRAFPSARFLFVGEGPLKRKLEDQAQRLGVRRFIDFLGRRSDIAALLGAADLFVFPTRFEGESFALMEAAAAGVPIVASRASGIPETFRDGQDALLFTVDSTSELVEKVLSALRDPIGMQARSANAVQRVREYSEAQMLDDTFMLLEAIASERGELRSQSQSG
jgi:glycosyltransferase involved in cell wall biosynthesis